MTKQGTRGVVLAAGLIALVLALYGCGGNGDEESTQPAHYAVDIYNGWPQLADEQQVGRYLESEWYDPADREVTIAIDSRVADQVPPIADAELARVQTTDMPQYRERGLKRVKLSGRPAIRWDYGVAGESRVAFFFEACETDFVVRGRAFQTESYIDSFREMAATIQPRCSSG